MDDISGLGLSEGDQISYRALLLEGDGNEVQTQSRTLTVAPPEPITTAVIHYRRPAGDYGDWGLHLFGDAVADEVLSQVSWNTPWPYASVGADGWARFEIPLKNDTVPLNFIIHRPGGDSVPVTREPGGDRSILPINTPEVWIVAGDPTIHASPPGS